MASIKTIAAGPTHADGVLLGGTGEKVGIFGATPIEQPASADQTAVGADPTNAELATLANALRTALVDLGALKGAA